MPEMRVKVDNTIPEPVNVAGPVTSTQSGVWNVGVTGQPISNYLVSNPALTGVYLFSLAGALGVVAANTFLTAYNPVSSGKTVSFSAAFISTVATAASGAIAPMRGYRFSGAPTGGTVQGSATIAKLNNAYPDAVLEVRTNNPTVALGPALWNTPPAVTSGAGGGQFVHDVDLPAGSPPLVLAPGEGVAINCSAGDVDQVWNFTIAWGEI